VDNNFVNQSFLGRESLADGGLSLDYVVPPKYVGNQWIEAIAQVVSGEGSEDQPVVNNNAFVQSPAFNGHLLWNHDVAKDWNLEVGGSFYAGKHDADVRQSTFLYGLDGTLIHQDPTGKFNNQIFEAEAIYGTTDTSHTDTQHSFGAYVLAQQQINHDWYAGVRLDWTKDAIDERRQIWGVSPYLSWYWSEFLRWRIEYQHRGGAGDNAPSEDALLFQATFIFGTHPPHPYWAMR
jgi:hypothetical protein